MRTIRVQPEPWTEPRRMTLAEAREAIREEGVEMLLRAVDALAAHVDRQNVIEATLICGLIHGRVDFVDVHENGFCVTVTQNQDGD